MANTYTSLNYHIIFSTKNRQPWLALGIATCLVLCRRHRTEAQDDGVAGRRRRRSHPRFNNGATNSLAQPDCSASQRGVFEVDP